MAKYLFIVGRPGSGKSTIGRAIVQAYGGEQHVAKLNDYLILWDMFTQEENGLVIGRRQFRRTEKDGTVGFEVIDRQVFPIALYLLDERACQYRQEPKLVILEFARNSYTDILRCFRPDITNNAHFLFLQTPLEECIQRIQCRVKQHHFSDDRLVAEDTMRKHHQDDGLASLLAVCEPEQVSIINNEGSPLDTWFEVKGRLDEVLYRVARPGVWSMASFNQNWPLFKNPKRETPLL